MKKLGWLRCKVDPNGGRRARKDYRLSAEGHKVLELIREQLRELYNEVILERGNTGNAWGPWGALRLRQ